MNTTSGPMPFLRLAGALLLTLCLTACGGGGGSGNATPPPPPVPDNPAGPGHFEQASLITTVSASAITSALPAGTGNIIKPLYDVDAWRVTYTTSDAQGRSVVASGLVAIPRKSGNPASPVLGYQHATLKTNAESPSNHATPDEPAILFASLGYLVSAADYVGYGATRGMPHPYLLAAPTAASVADFLVASSRFRQIRGIAENGQLFLTGYSEGAYASMATLRHLTRNRIQPLPLLTYMGAGPYSVTRTLNDMVAAARARNPVVGALINPGFLKHLGANDRANVRNLLLFTALGDDTDITFDPAFLDHFLADDNTAIEAMSNVHDWTPQSALVLFHGRDDTTATYANTELAYQAMQARGAGALVERVDCPAQPASHIGCVPAFLMANVARLGAVARGL